MARFTWGSSCSGYPSEGEISMVGSDVVPTATLFGSGPRRVKTPQPALNTLLVDPKVRRKMTME